MLLSLVEAGVLERDPFMLVDVGCGLGLDSAWRLFGSALNAHGFDPQLEEVGRLAREEKNPNVAYHTAFVGLPDDDPFVRQRREDAEAERLFDPFGRTSTMAALAGTTGAAETPFHAETNDWPSQELATEKVQLGGFLRSHGVASVDFVKIDTDGGDFEVLRSFEESIEATRTLGFMVETPFTGSAAETANTFHNIDRLLKRHGFLLCTLSVNRYSRAALPAPFTYSILAQTVWGQTIWGDTVYLREGVHPDHVRFGDLSPMKLLKLACLYELFRAPDCAAELLVTHRDLLSELVDVDGLLDLLTPPLDGHRVGYREYLAAFAADPTRFYPDETSPPEWMIRADRAMPQSVSQLARRVLGRAPRSG